MWAVSGCSQHKTVSCLIRIAVLCLDEQVSVSERCLFFWRFTASCTA